MKALKLLIFGFFLVGCGGGVENGIILSKEVLTKQDYYSSYITTSTTDCAIEYAKYSFKDSSYKKIVYSDNNYLNVEKTINDKVEYLTPINVTLYEGKNIFDCTVAYEENDAVTLVCLNRTIGGEFSVFRHLFATKQAALNALNSDCLK